MESLAVELLMAIFAFACTDGGRTGCSLALVCKHFREVSRPLRFHSVALTGVPDQLKRFFVLFERERAALGATFAPKVRHAFIRTERVEGSPLDQASSTSVSGETRATPSEEDIEHGQCREDEDEDDAAPPRTRSEYTELVSALLRAIAPTLETLVFLPLNITRDAEPLDPGIIFPVLREITLGSPLLYHMSSNPRSLLPQRAYPSLTRLHLRRSTDGQRSDDWVYHAPGLTHISVSSVGYRTHVTSFKLFFDCSGTQPAEQPFKKLQTLIIHLAPPPSVRFCHGTPRLRYERVVAALWESQAEATVPIYIFPTGKDKMEGDWSGAGSAWYGDVDREEWEDRMQGGVGCWGVENEYARRAYKEKETPGYLAPWWPARPRGLTVHG
ncbi:hypothetical protein VTO73DRAFT_13537 [Trametes versicolor]